jgi:hypothetical protein
MLTEKQKRQMKARREADQTRDRAARQQRARAQQERAQRLVASEERAGAASRRVRDPERLEAYRNTPTAGVHGARSRKKDAGGPPENKALAGPPENKAEDWPHKMQPHVYLKLNPTGPSADLARRIVARD